MNDDDIPVTPVEGWSWLYNDGVWHYFVKQVSLCNHWKLYGSLVVDHGDHLKHCRECEKQLKKKNKR